MENEAMRQHMHDTHNNMINLIILINDVSNLNIGRFNLNFGCMYISGKAQHLRVYRVDLTG